MGLNSAEAATSQAGFGHAKIGVVGVGAVAAATSLALLERGVCPELVLVDKNFARVRESPWT